MTALDEDKQALRRRMRQLRLIADQKQGPDAVLGLLHIALPRLDALGLRPGVVAAGYWPIATEIDIRPLMARLGDRGVILALPVLVEEGGTLAFRRWQPTDELEEGPHGTMHPFASQPVLRPQVVFVPLLAFDAAGNRLGQGGGYYDRTLAALRRSGPVTAVGVGYAIQRRDRVPADDGDARLDWILTEDALVAVAR
jgi:5-formyltetrahydrofolate cyclo-ligase